MYMHQHIFYNHALLDSLAALTGGIYHWIFIGALIVFGLEFLSDVLQQKVDKKVFRESFGSLFTLVPVRIVEFLVFSVMTLGFFAVYQLVPWKLPLTWPIAVLALFLSDFIYYVEHRLAHRVRILWLAHSVHHSAQIMNTSTAFRFSMIDPFISAALYLPLILLGFHPGLVIGAELIVRAYQFFVHNSWVPKLGVIDRIFNTPSVHRVHHDRVIDYRDTNYGGILIIWDRLFRTYQAEDRPIDYGLPKQINSWNPIDVQLHEFPLLAQDLKAAKGWREKLHVLFGPPEWIRTREGIFADAK